MNYKKLNGIWQGSYKYGSMYPEHYRNLIETFTVDIQFDDVNFKGTCIDGFTNQYFHAPATVEGTYVPNLISFIKRYPSLLTVDDNMRIIVMPDKPSSEIHYTGFYYKGLFSKTIRFEGEWMMTDYVITENSKKEYFSLSGTWQMKK